MVNLFKRAVITYVKLHKLKKIDKECNRYFKLQSNLLRQQSKISKLIFEYENLYEERILSREE